MLDSIDASRWPVAAALLIRIGLDGGAEFAAECEQRLVAVEDSKIRRDLLHLVDPTSVLFDGHPALQRMIAAERLRDTLSFGPLVVVTDPSLRLSEEMLVGAPLAALTNLLIHHLDLIGNGVELRRLAAGNLPIKPHRPWVDQLVRWSGRVGNAVDPGQGRGARLDVLVRQAGDPDIRILLQYSIRAFLGRVRRSGSPGEQVRSAGSIPEAILQSLCAYLGLNPLDVPDELPDLDYQRFFGNLGDYRRPKAGSRLDLTHLLVIVPALLVSRCDGFSDQIQLCNAQFVRPLHQRLIFQMRNATAHTYSEMDEADATFFFNVCENFLADATAVWERDGTAAPHPDPDHEALADLLHGLILAG